MRYTVLISTLLLAGAMFQSIASAAQPVVTAVAPTGVLRGAPTVVTLTGTRVSDARQILFETPGLNAVDVKPIDNKSVEVTITADPDLSPGLYAFRLATETGISNMRLLSVGAMPIVEEVEPNNEFASPQKIEMNVTVTGIVQREDEDYFSIDLKQGQRVCCEIEGARLSYYPRNGSDFFDPFIAILDADRFEQVTSDDDPLLQQDGVFAYIAPEDGTYVIVVRDSSFGGGGDANYRLHVGDFPRPVSVVPAGGRPGETIAANIVDVDGTVTQTEIALPSLESFDYSFSMASETGVAPSPNNLRVLPMEVVVEQEPNDNIRQPNVATAPLPLAFCGTIGDKGDFDSFAFEAKKGQKVITRLYARSVLRSPLDAVTDIFDPEFKRVAGADDTGGPDCVAEFTPAADGVHVVRVYDHLRGGSPSFSYRLEVEAAKPDLILSLPEERERRDEAVDISVPRGSQVAVMVNAQRLNWLNFGGDIELSLENLPAGLTATTFTMPANRPTIPLLLSAAPDAELAAARVNLIGTHKTDNLTVSGNLLQRHKLISGQNRVDVWGVDSDRAAIAVTKESPVSIELVQPTTPVVRNGSIELKVIAHRNEGFDAVIPVRLLYVSPGLSTNNSRKIEKGQTEITIPVTANKNSQLGDWPMIITAFANVGNGSIKLSSTPVSLTVEDKFFNFKFIKTAAEQGAQAQVIVEVEVAREFEGTADVTLVGLPAGVTSPTPTQPITAETTQIAFPIEIAADARAGNHKTMVCQAVVHSATGDIPQTEGTGELQIDVPLPAPTTPAPEAAPAAKAAPDAALPVH